jgi:hypothetical protein
VSSTIVQPESQLLLPGFLPSLGSAAEQRALTAPNAVNTVVASKTFGPGLLQAKDFDLPEMVGKADNGDISVGVCIDDVQLRQVFELADVDQEGREFASLPMAEQHLEKRRYKDFLKRKAKKGLCSDELEIWLQGGAQAEENFGSWWEQKEERRRTALLRKANRLANCGVCGRRLDCSEHPDHRFFGTFNCGVRYCRYCGAAIFAGLFGKYMGLWPIVEKLVVRPGFRVQNVIATLDFTAVNLGRMPIPKDIREFNQDVRACIQRVTAKLSIASNQFLFLWCDEFGGWDPKKKKYNTNLHAHGVYVGPFLPYDLLLEAWIAIRKSKDGARGVFIKTQKLDHPPRDLRERERARFARALGHALKYTGKHVGRADGERLAKLEAAFHGVRRVHTMGLAYHADLGCSCQCSVCQRPCEGFNGHQGEHSCKCHRAGPGCPMCSSPLMFPRESGYPRISLLKKEGRVDLDEARRQVARKRVFAGPRGAPP